MESLPLSTSAQAVLTRAAQESSRLGHRFLGVDHVFTSLALDNDSIARAFEAHGIGLSEFVTRLVDGIEPLQHHPWGTEVLVTPRCQDIVNLATKIAARHRKPQVTPEHLLEAIFREGRSVPMRLLQSNEIRIAELYEAIVPRVADPSDTSLPLLERFGRDLTAQAKEGALMPVVGRESETRTVEEILLRKRKNNPVLIGE